jgi:plasmid stability protein
MAQLTIRLDDELAKDVKNVAAASGKSGNAWIVSVLRAAVDPDLEDSDIERTRARLARAGLLWTPTRERPARRPDPELVRRARAAAGRGKSLSELVSEGRD